MTTIFLFWHLYGCTDSLNHKTILSLSPLLDALRDGEFEEVEHASGAVPFVINGQRFNESQQNYERNKGAS
jgi:hypothetical protein